MALGHTLRKLRQWDAAIDCYQQALGLKPGQVGIFRSCVLCFGPCCARCHRLLPAGSGAEAGAQAHLMHFSCTAVHGRHASDVNLADAGRCCCLSPRVGALAAVSAYCHAASCPPLAPIGWICTAHLLQPGTYSALGYAHHLKGDVDAAIEQYHKVRGFEVQPRFLHRLCKEWLHSRKGDVDAASELYHKVNSGI